MNAVEVDAMIITRLRGGLGNQLFQYAAGQAAALRYDQRHFLDLRFFEVNSHRDFGLRKFNISAGIASEEVLPPLKESELFRYAVWKYFGRNPTYVRDMDFVNASNVEPQRAKHKFHRHAYMAGLWCSELFFSDFAAEIRQELSFTGMLSERGSDIMDQIREGTSVSLHIRRGDYVQSDAVMKRFGVCSGGYYDRALKHVRSKLNGEFKIFVFSDDLSWARENLCAPEELVFVDAGSVRAPHEDLRLMAACDHHITANSTFSWWGAWLNADPDKTVVCPEEWYVSRKKTKFRIAPIDWVAYPAFD